MANFGAQQGMVSQNSSATIDLQGNAIISPDTSFGASPAGVGLLTQQLFGLANATFNLTPPDVNSAISFTNAVPYWDLLDYSNGVMSGSAVQDSTTKTWGIAINPGTATTNDYITFRTRSYLVNDDNLGLRQRATTVLSRTGTPAAGTTWNLTLTATYYDATDTAVSTAVVGTVYEPATWTSISGYTTTGGTAIPASARYVDLAYTLTATAPVTGSAIVTIKSCLLASKVGANSAFLVTETFKANATWTRPTGVDYLVALAGCGAGGGGGGGALTAASTGGNTAIGGGGGGAGGWFYIRDLYVGDQTTVSVGIGVGGVGGTAVTFTKAAAATTTSTQTGSTGSNGGDSTFGSLVTFKAGSAGAGVVRGGVGGAATTTIYLGTNVSGGGGGGGGGVGTAGTASGFSSYTAIPYSVASATGSTGGTSTGAGGNQNVGGAGGTSTLGWIGGGGGGVSVQATATPTVTAGGPGANGGGGSGGARAIYINATATVTGTAGNGGSGGTNVGAGGGGGGGIAVSASLAAPYNASSLTIASGAGGSGSDGFISVTYVA